MFIQIIQGRCTRQDECQDLMQQWVAEIGNSADGWLGGTFGFTDDDTFMGVVRFESKEKAMALSGSEEQGRWWDRFEALFDGPVEFHNCDRVQLMLEGGSDDARFVQVIRGRVEDPNAFLSDMESMNAMLHEARPDILGATFAIEDDGTFTETVAFKDEKSAREGEMHEMPLRDDVRDAFTRWDSMTKDLTYYDLHQPWFTSHA